MTPKEAINKLNNMKEYYYNDKPEPYYVGFDNEDNEALNMAIKALKQIELNPSYNSIKTELEPCEDCISRTALLSRIDEERKHLLDVKMDGAEHVIVHHARRIIEDIPSVTPKGVTITDFADRCRECGRQTGWIPVSERLPEEGMRVLICNTDGQVDLARGYYSTEIPDCFDWYIDWKFGDVIAWMPLPQPYAESEEKDE